MAAAGRLAAAEAGQRHADAGQCDDGQHGAADLKADMVKVASSFDLSDDATLILRQDYLEAVISKPASP